MLRDEAQRVVLLLGHLQDTQQCAAYLRLEKSLKPWHAVCLVVQEPVRIENKRSAALVVIHRKLMLNPSSPFAQRLIFGLC